MSSDEPQAQLSEPMARWESADADPTLLAQRLRFPYACNVVAPNRFMKSAMSEQMATYEQSDMIKSGIPTRELINLYEKFADGGFGIIITGAIMVNGKDLEAPGNVIIDRSLDSEERRATFKDWTQATKKNGSVFLAQLFHPGTKAADLPHKTNFDINKLTHDQISELVEQYAYAATFSQECGFDGVEISCAYFFALGQFLTHGENTRTDEYGGSLENRARILFRIIQAIRMRVRRPNNFAIGLKLFSGNFEPDYNEDEFGTFIRSVEKTGFDYITITGGRYYLLKELKEGEEITNKHQQFYQAIVPVIKRNLTRTKLYMNGGFVTLADMCEAIRSGSAMGVSLARPVAAEPGLPNKLLNGEVKGAVKSLIDPLDIVSSEQFAGTQLWQHGWFLPVIDASNPEHVEQFKKELEKHQERKTAAHADHTEPVIGYPKVVLCSEETVESKMNEFEASANEQPVEDVTLDVEASKEPGEEQNEMTEERTHRIVKKQIDNRGASADLQENLIEDTVHKVVRKSSGDEREGFEVIEETIEKFVRTEHVYAEPPHDYSVLVSSAKPQEEELKGEKDQERKIEVAETSAKPEEQELVHAESAPEAERGVVEPSSKKDEVITEKVGEPLTADVVHGEGDKAEYSAAEASISDKHEVVPEKEPLTLQEPVTDVVQEEECRKSEHVVEAAAPEQHDLAHEKGDVEDVQETITGVIHKEELLEHEHDAVKAQTSQEHEVPREEVVEKIQEPVTDLVKEEGAAEPSVLEEHESIHEKDHEKIEALASEITEEHAKVEEPTKEITEDHEKVEKPIKEVTEDHEKVEEPTKEITEDHEKVEEPIKEVIEDHEKVEEPTKEITEDHEKVEEPTKEITEDHEKVEEPTKEIIKDHEKVEEPTKEVTEDHEKVEEPVSEVIEDHRKAEEPTKDVTEGHEKVEEPIKEIIEDHEKVEKPTKEITEGHEKVEKPIKEVTEDHEKVEEPTKEITEDHEKVEEPTKEITEDHEKVEEPTKEIIKDHEKVEEPTKEITEDHEKVEEPTKEIIKDHEKVEEPTKEITEGHEKAEEPVSEVIEDHGKTEEPTKEVTEGHEKVEEPTKEVTEDYEKVEEPTKEITEDHEKVEEPTKEITEDHEKVEEPTKEITKDHEKVEEPTKEITKDHEKVEELASEITEDHGKVEEPASEVTEEGDRAQKSPEKVAQEELPKPVEEPTSAVPETAIEVRGDIDWDNEPDSYENVVPVSYLVFPKSERKEVETVEESTAEEKAHEELPKSTTEIIKEPDGVSGEQAVEKEDRIPDGIEEKYVLTEEALSAEKPSAVEGDQLREVEKASAPEDVVEETSVMRVERVTEVSPAREPDKVLVDTELPSAASVETSTKEVTSNVIAGVSSENEPIISAVASEESRPEPEGAVNEISAESELMGSPLKEDTIKVVEDRPSAEDIMRQSATEIVDEMKTPVASVVEDYSHVEKKTTSDEQVPSDLSAEAHDEFQKPEEKKDIEPETSVDREVSDSVAGVKNGSHELEEAVQKISTGLTQVKLEEISEKLDEVKDGTLPTTHTTLFGSSLAQEEPQDAEQVERLQPEHELKSSEDAAASVAEHQRCEPEKKYDEIVEEFSETTAAVSSGLTDAAPEDYDIAQHEEAGMTEAVASEKKSHGLSSFITSALPDSVQSLFSSKKTKVDTAQEEPLGAEESEHPSEENITEEILSKTERKASDTVYDTVEPVAVDVPLKKADSETPVEPSKEIIGGLSPERVPIVSGLVGGEESLGASHSDAGKESSQSKQTNGSAISKEDDAKGSSHSEYRETHVVMETRNGKTHGYFYESSGDKKSPDEMDFEFIH
uniref:NADH:flavin oxidoreductase/NADH oxidase N-terminal domain-containing protein n=1 Tax=Parascaris univalens TaxID=6257 RepID=A0A915BRU6_PARUN